MQGLHERSDQEAEQHQDADEAELAQCRAASAGDATVGEPGHDGVEDEHDRAGEHQRRENDPELPSDPENDRRRRTQPEQRPRRPPSHREPIEHQGNRTGTPAVCRGHSYGGVMDAERPPRVLPSLVLFVVGVIVALMVLGWIVGAIFSILKFALLVGGAVAVIWAVLASRSNR